MKRRRKWKRMKRERGFGWEEKPKGGARSGVRERGRKKEKKGKKRKREKYKGHVEPCEWVGGDNEILPSQPDCDMW